MQALIDWNKDKLLREDVDILLGSPRSYSFGTALGEGSVEMRREEVDVAVGMAFFSPDPTRKRRKPG